MTKAQKRRRAQELDDLQFLCKQPEGQRFLFRMLGTCMVFGEPYVVGSFDGTAFNCGRSSIGRMLIADLEESGDKHRINLMAMVMERGKKEAYKANEEEEQERKEEASAGAE